MWACVWGSVYSLILFYNCVCIPYFIFIEQCATVAAMFIMFIMMIIFYFNIVIQLID